MSDRHAGNTSSKSDQFDRRAAFRSLALGGVAVFAGFGLSGETLAQGLPVGCVQEGWRWCHKCQGMFYGLASAGAGGLGRCPAGGAHDPSQSGHYYQRIGGDIANVQQGGWRWCSKCMGLFYSRASAGLGRCPAGGAHNGGGSSAYASLLGNTATGRQGAWRWCRKCQGMFYSGNNLGVCPAGGAHDPSASGQYATLT